MTTITYTPGPWEDNGNGLIYGQCSGDDDEAPFVADVCDDPNAYPDQEQANACLIAAAPELLEALIYVRATLTLRHLDEASDDEVEEALKIGAAAIAKATTAWRTP